MAAGTLWPPGCTATGGCGRRAAGIGAVWLCADAMARTPAAGHCTQRGDNGTPKGTEASSGAFAHHSHAGQPHPSPSQHFPQHQPCRVRNSSRNIMLGVRNQRAMPPSLAPSPTLSHCPGGTHTDSAPFQSENQAPVLPVSHQHPLKKKKIDTSLTIN